MTIKRALFSSLFAAAFGVSACGDATGPTEGVRIDATAAEIAATSVMVADVRSRLFPSIGQLAGVPELETAVAALAQAVQRVNAADVERNARAASEALARVRAGSTIAEAPDLDAIDLAIGAAAKILDRTTNFRTPR